jgi:2-amino-4-hydroxy-6-hydroxymethyldihydropteridine diphosphokinase
MTALVWLSLGSNLGDRTEHLRFAVKELRDHPQISVEKISSLYQTSPWGVTEQEDYYNAAVGIVTGLAPQQLLNYLQQIEKRAGRRRRSRWAARELDIDILLYDLLLVDEAQLTIPHPRLQRRLFMLIPLLEISGNIKIPQAGYISDLIASNEEGQSVEKVISDRPWYEE